MARLAERVEDHRVLVLIGRMLKARVVLPDGVKVSTEEGVPQFRLLSARMPAAIYAAICEQACGLLARRKWGGRRNGARTLRRERASEMGSAYLRAICRQASGLSARANGETDGTEVAADRTFAEREPHLKVGRCLRCSPTSCWTNSIAS